MLHLCRQLLNLKRLWLSNEVLQLKFSNKGGYLSEVKLNKFVDYDSIPIYLIKDGNASFNINFGTTDSRILNTQDLYFEPTVSNEEWR